MTESRTIVARTPEGEEVLIQIYTGDTEGVHVATREKSWHSWGPPLEIVEDDKRVIV